MRGSNFINDTWSGAENACSPGIIRLAVMLFVRFPLSLRNVEDFLRERDINLNHEIIRF
jgi:hypothetical protein